MARSVPPDLYPAQRQLTMRSILSGRTAIWILRTVQGFLSPWKVTGSALQDLVMDTYSALYPVLPLCLGTETVIHGMGCFCGMSLDVSCMSGPQR